MRDLFMLIFDVKFLTFFILNLRLKSRFSFLIAKMHIKLIRDETTRHSQNIYFFNFIDVFMLTNKPCIVNIKEKVTLRHIIDRKEVQE